MTIDTSKLVDALSKVVDLAHRELTAKTDLNALYRDAEKVQSDIDNIAAQLIAAAQGSNAETAGITAVAAALGEA